MANLNNQSGVLAEDQLLEIEQWQRGRELRNVVNTEAWQIITDTLKRYSDVAVEELLRIAPGDPAVPTAHAAASALVQQYKSFMEDVTVAVQSSYQVPDALKNTIRDAATTVQKMDE